MTGADGTSDAALSPEVAARELYIDLLKGVLTRSIFDEAMSPVMPIKPVRRAAFEIVKRLVFDPAHVMLVRKGAIVQQRRELGWDHPLDAETMVGLKRLDNLQHCVETVLRERIPGDLLEAGVWRGGSAILMQGILRAWGETGNRAVWVCDSFEGLPPPRPEEFPADKGDTLWKKDYLAVSQADVERNFSRYGLLDDNVRFLRGFFQDTLPAAPVGQLAVLRADADMYESTITILGHLYPKVADGGFVIVDDYNGIAACRQAVDTYRDTHGIRDPIEEIDWTGVFWRKTG